MGNESCDLDSAVSAISLAYYYQNNETEASHITHLKHFLPILNIPRRDYPLKTEVKYMFQKNNINDELLTFKDELNDDFLKNNQYVLVDHHVSPWTKKSIAIYDHRPKDELADIPDKCKVNLYLVGSCATLIAEEFIKSKMLGEIERDILNLLRSTIVLDTVNFSKDAARATPKDVEICSALEEVLEKSYTLQSRDKLFEDLVKARADVSSLTASQLLRKDLKILSSSKDNSVKVALPGFPLPVQQFILKDNADEAIKEFSNEFNCSVVLLMGMYVHPDDNSVHRDFGLININNQELCETIKTRLLSLDELNLSVENCKDCNFMDGSFYKQFNIKVTRKHILPIIKKLIDE